MPQIRFSIDAKAMSYLNWLADEVVLAKSGDEAAKQLFLSKLEEMRRDQRTCGPDLAQLQKIYPPAKEK